MSKKWIKRSLLLGGITGLVVPLTTACAVGTNKFVVGNYDAYISPKVSDELQTNFKTNHNNFLSYLYYSNNEVVEGYLKAKSLDIAVISQYTVAKLAKRGVIKKLDWSKFDLHDKDGQLITSSKQLKSIFSDTTWLLSQAYSDYLGDLDGDNEKEQLLDYMVPYFYQDLIFGYRGQVIEKLKPENNPTWSDIFWAMQNDSRFNPNKKVDLYTRDEETVSTNKNLARLTFISDPRTIYDLARIIETSENLSEQDYKDLVKWQTWINLEKTKENPDLAKILKWEELYREKAPRVHIQNNAKIKDIEKTFNYLLRYTKDLPHNTVRFDPNSNNVLNNLATLETVGVIGYNGDISFALNGGEYADVPQYKNKIPTTEDFHFVRPKYTLNVMDGFVINALVDEEHIEGAYDYIKQLIFQGINDVENDGVLRWGLKIHKGMNDQDIEKYETTNLDDEEEGDVLSDQGYLYAPMQNFDYVNYTPTLRAIYDNVLDESEGYLGNDAFQIDLIKERLANQANSNFLENEYFGINSNYATKRERQNKHILFDELANVIYALFEKNKKEDGNFDFDVNFLDEEISIEEKEPVIVFESLKNALLTAGLINSNIDDQELKRILATKLTNLYDGLADEIAEKIALNNINREIFKVVYNLSTLERPINDLTLSNIIIAYDDYRAKN
ncbi:hypothetical protein OF377_03220 [Ureaplasma sp. ES3154-GEN]|uniref:hypothetical protein n=1 Tax=Ureaplasma sp. ES3154-GEN TaxID=2984844 RepID=UPI0021E75887|nr:hypothetical protein [Ureaplasma sp. ES3154-GEN]MCV3743871.1 hypothetical protein [Ureaplasma sp. ES3154-GEN]